MNITYILINKSKIGSFCNMHHIAFLALFCSILTSHFTTTCDVDILVKFEEEHIPSLFDIVDMESELTSIIGRQVDLKTPNDLSPYFRNEVLSTAKVLYSH